jgi:hypothetical protein
MKAFAHWSNVLPLNCAASSVDLASRLAATGSIPFTIKSRTLRAVS